MPIHPKLPKESLFITFEGTEGSGKSTLIRNLVERFQELGVSPVVTREPGGHRVAEKIRELLLHEEMDPWTELFLYEASRAEHLAKTLLPSLKEKRIVLCDRYADSSLAYQSYTRGLPWKEVKALNRLATQGLKPDLTFLLDIDPALGLERAQDKNRFEAEGVAFQKKVRLGFLKAKKDDPRRWCVLKVDGVSPEAIAARAWKEIQRRFEKRMGGLFREKK